MFNGGSELGNVNVVTSMNRGHSPEQITELALNKIIDVSSEAPPVIRDQAVAHKDRLREILLYYMKSMANSERTTIWALMKKQGHEEIAEIIRRL
tara:strand:+ start:5709 stop:5993 length:285 start_codon:yes stop_codon:yes gene_type:complete